MTAPIRVTEGTLYGYTPAQWREAAQNALSALRANPNDTEALDQLNMARMVIGEHAQQLGARAQIAARADTEEAMRMSPVMSAGLGFSQGATFGLGDEAAALIQVPFSMFRRGMNARRAYLNQRDADRAVLAQAQAANPAAYFAGEVAGGAAGGAGAGKAVTRVLPGAARALVAATRPGATLGQQALGAAASGTVAAPIGALFGYGTGEEGPIADLGDAATGGVVAGTLGAILGPVVANASRRVAVRAANDAEAVARLGTEQARRGMYEARARQISRQLGSDMPPGMDPAEYTLRNSPLLRRMSPADQDAAIARMRNTPGNPLYRAPVESAPAQQAPSTQRTAEPGITSSEVDAAMAEGRAGLAAQRNTPVPDGPVEVPAILQPNGAAMPQSRGEAARAAYGQVLAATGDEAQAAQAARHVAGHATPATPTPGAPDILSIISGGPTEEARVAVLGLLRSSAPAQQQLIAQQLRMNPLWAAWLRQAGL